MGAPKETRAFIDALTRLNFYKRINHVPSKKTNEFKKPNTTEK